MDKVVEVMRIKRLPPMGKLVVEIGSQQYERFSQLPSDVIKQLVLAAVGELIVFTDGYQTLVDAGVAPPIVGPISDGDFKVDASISERKAVFRAAIEEERLASLTGDGREVVVEPQEVKNVTIDDPTQLKEDLDIAGQVNVFLQKQVQQTPELRGRSIYIAGDATGSLSIFVDGRIFETPSDIEDQLVRAAIQEALKAWEASKQATL
ncbi:MAG: hypothetical protein BMS9Abin02_0047 [Anaerolineae bacterium]|nr:MAG: hypothetical protein BMS9Abin02_0047 [Anaerolineae bacterium]